MISLLLIILTAADVYLISASLAGEHDKLFLDKRKGYKYARLRMILTIAVLPVLIVYMRKRNYLKKRNLTDYSAIEL